MPDDEKTPTEDPETREAKEEGLRRGGESTPPEPGGGRPEAADTDAGAPG